MDGEAGTSCICEDYDEGNQLFPLICYSSRQFQACLCHTILKKNTLDPESLSSYRPVSQLQFIPKIIEKVVADCLCPYLKDNNTLKHLLSAYKPGHSVETALIRVTSDILKSLDNKQMVLLVLLDLSAAFDTVDHDLLLARMYHHFGMSDDVLKWFRSFLNARSQYVVIADSTSEQRNMDCGVPHGSVLGPVLFTMYTSSLGHIAKRHGMNYHLYADDTHLHVAFKPGSSDLADCQHIQDCMVEMQLWMDSNFLKLNNEKTDVVLMAQGINTRSSICIMSPSVVMSY